MLLPSYSLNDEAFSFAITYSNMRTVFTQHLAT